MREAYFMCFRVTAYIFPVSYYVHFRYIHTQYYSGRPTPQRLAVQFLYRVAMVLPGGNYTQFPVVTYA